MENVFIFESFIRAKHNDTIDESTPPERKAPIGTSEIERLITLFSTKSLTFVFAISKEVTVFSIDCFSSMRLISNVCELKSYSIKWLDSSFFIPSYIVKGAGMYVSLKYKLSPFLLILGLMGINFNKDLSSDAQINSLLV